MKRSLPPAPHTPGPWRVYQEKPHYYSVGTDYELDRGHDSNIVRDVRCEANARVMAAAPELLSALECAATVLFLLEDEVKRLGHSAGNVLPKVKAAIAKAKGVSL